MSVQPVPRAPSSCRVRRTPLRGQGRVEAGPLGHSALGLSLHRSKPRADFGFLLLVRHLSSSFLALVCVTGLALLPRAASARELRWRELSVDARLDARGELHVRERHRMVFSGDWNGGERRFRVPLDQALRFESIARLEPDGSTVPLVAGDLSLVGQFAWVDRETLRWRTRLPGDAEFEQTELGYVIDYGLAGVLLDEGDRAFRLSHDFAFPDRPGVIERFALRLVLDPAWRSDRPSPIELEQHGLPPGRGAVLELELHYTGATPPVALADWERSLRRLGAQGPLHLALAAAYLALAALLVRLTFARERRLGRFAEVPRAGAEDDWLERHVRSLQPEVAGTIYHGRVSSAEVGALLARLELERKLATRPGRGSKGAQLELRLLVPRDVFVSYERELIDALFFDGDETSSLRIRQHYDGRGFAPQALIQDALEERASYLVGFEKSSAASSWVSVLLVAVALGLNVAITNVTRAERQSEADWLASAAVLATAGFVIIGLWLARRFRNDYHSPATSRALLSVGLALGAAWVVYLLLESVTLSLSGALALWALGLVLTLLVLVAARSRAAMAPGVAVRRSLAIARRLFQARHEAATQSAPGKKQPEPVDVSWLPYLVALDLQEAADLCIRGPTVRASSFDTHRDGVHPRLGGSTERREPGPIAGDRSSEAARWAGDGGLFGGAGASSSWSSAAEGLARGVEGPASSAASRSFTPSSSTSSTSSSSGSGSDDRSGGSQSGGGGGGGW
jgi:hypothetical protein